MAAVGRWFSLGHTHTEYGQKNHSEAFVQCDTRRKPIAAGICSSNPVRSRETLDCDTADAGPKQQSRSRAKRRGSSQGNDGVDFHGMTDCPLESLLRSH